MFGVAGEKHIEFFVVHDERKAARRRRRRRDRERARREGVRVLCQFVGTGDACV
jgi:hypothetical protein